MGTEAAQQLVIIYISAGQPAAKRVTKGAKRGRWHTFGFGGGTIASEKGVPSALLWSLRQRGRWRLRFSRTLTTNETNDEWNEFHIVGRSMRGTEELGKNFDGDYLG
ncbi:hypothetical protein Ddc_11018 [Ditylenchus destructor]|nr:hypothetical protein Ddc_11018 [Ditylenchus destructor]